MLNFGQVQRKILEVTTYIQRLLFPPETEKTPPLSQVMSLSILILQKKMMGDELIWDLIFFRSYLSHTLRIFNSKDGREQNVSTFVNFWQNNLFSR